MMYHHLFGGVFLSESLKRSFDLSFLLRAAAAWILCAIVLLLSGTVLYTSGAASLSKLGYGSLVISFFSALGAGAAAVKPEKGRRMLSGLGSALFITAALLVCGFLIREKLETSSILCIAGLTLAGCLLGSCLPGRKRRRGNFRPMRMRYGKTRK